MASRNITALFFVLLLFSIPVSATFAFLTARDLGDESPECKKSIDCKNKIVKLEKFGCVLVNGQFRLLDKNNSLDDRNKFFKKHICTVWVFDSMAEAD